MFIDLLARPDSFETQADVCVIGAGAAGITLVRELASTGLEVCLLESGGFRPDARTQSLNQGESLGFWYDLSETRVRYFGGSTNREGWGGWCKPLDPIDFQTRSWVPHSGWPIDLGVLGAVLSAGSRSANSVQYDYGLESWRDKVDLNDLPLRGHQVETQLAQLSPPTRLARGTATTSRASRT